MIDADTITQLQILDIAVNDAIDNLISKRDAAVDRDKYTYRYITRKLEGCIGLIHNAMDKAEVR